MWSGWVTEVLRAGVPGSCEQTGPSPHQSPSVLGIYESVCVTLKRGQLAFLVFVSRLKKKAFILRRKESPVIEEDRALGHQSPPGRAALSAQHDSGPRAPEGFPWVPDLG